MTEPFLPEPIAAPPDTTTQVAAADVSGKSFWQIVGAAFRSRLLNRLATRYIGIMILVAVFVPFLANSRPFAVWFPDQTLTATVDGREVANVIPAHWEFPLFRALDRVDLILLVDFALLIAYYVTLRRSRRITEPEERRALLFRHLLVVLGLGLVLSLAIGLLRENRLDARNYRQLAAAGQVQHAVFAPLRWGYADMEPLMPDRTYEMPSRDHWVGTDGNGRDVLSRLLWSTRIVLGIGFIAETIALLIGISVGAIMGYYVGKVDLLGMRLVEIVESFPTFFLILTFVALFGRQIFIIMVILGLTGWTGIARFTRAEFLRLRNLDYVTAAIAAGLPLRRVLFRHMLPNGLTPVIVTLTFGIAGAVMSESSLSFLGVGIQPPTPSWGSMLNEAGNPAETFRWWLAVAPGLMIFLTVFAYNIIGEGLRDATDPRLNKQVQ